jgi:hypothetical protein
MMKKRLLVLASLLALLASGCITIRIETKINKDGSGEKSFVLALDKSVTSMMESVTQESGTSTDDIWASVRDGASSIKGAKIEEYSDDEAEGIKVSVPFGTFEELEALSSSDTFEGADTVTISQDGDITTFNAVVNAADITSGLDEAEGQSLEGFDLGEIEMEYTYAVEVDGKILEYSAQDIATVDGNRVTWDLTQAGSETIELMLKWKPGGGPDLLAILLIAVALGGLALIVAGVILAVRGKQN